METAGLVLKSVTLTLEVIKIVRELVKTVKEFKDDFETIDRELTAISGLMQSLYKDLNTCSQELIPPALKSQVKELVDSAEHVMRKADRTLRSYRVTGIKKHARVLLNGREDTQVVKQELIKLKTSLSFAVDMMTLYVWFLAFLLLDVQLYSSANLQTSQFHLKNHQSRHRSAFSGHTRLAVGPKTDITGASRSSDERKQGPMHHTSRGS
jgi:hypothetical protein